MLKALLESGWLRSRYPHAVAVGVLMALAFPKFEIPGLAWVAPALLLGLTWGCDARQVFRLGYLAGLAYHLTTLAWLLLIPVSFFPILGWLALSAYLSLFTAAWAWSAWRLWPVDNREPGGNGEPVAFPQLGRLPSWERRALWAVGVAATWVALEVVRARLLGGFPWNPLGASQYGLVPLIQISVCTGVYGVSFLVVWFAAALFCSGLGWLHTPLRRTAWLVDLVPPLLVIAGCFAWGLGQLKSAPPPVRELRVALVQPSIPQTEIWDPSENAERFKQLIALSTRVLSTEPDLLLWPEAAVPELLRWDPETHSAVTGLARTNAVWMILGADDALPGATPEEDVRYFNSAWLIGPDGGIRATYRKQQLVAFGEEVPFSRWLPFLRWFTPITGSFTRGTGFVSFQLKELGLEAVPLICFEDVFPQLVRRGVGSRTDLLVNLTNDGWFREGAAQQQQAANAVFRAVENRRPLIRCTNNGQTCWVDPFGRIVETFRDTTGSLYGSGTAVFTVGLPSETFSRTTVYTRHGDLFGWTCVVLGAAGLFFRRAGRGAT